MWTPAETGRKTKTQQELSPPGTKPSVCPLSMGGIRVSHGHLQGSRETHCPPVHGSSGLRCCPWLIRASRLSELPHIPQPASQPFLYPPPPERGYAGSRDTGGSRKPWPLLSSPTGSTSSYISSSPLQQGRWRLGSPAAVMALGTKGRIEDARRRVGNRRLGCPWVGPGSGTKWDGSSVPRASSSSQAWQDSRAAWCAGDGQWDCDGSSQNCVVMQPMKDGALHCRSCLHKVLFHTGLQEQAGKLKDTLPVPSWALSTGSGQPGSHLK